MTLNHARRELVDAIFDSWRLPADRLRERNYRVECHQMPGSFIDALITEALKRGIVRGRCTTWDWDDEPWLAGELEAASLTGLEQMTADSEHKYCEQCGDCLNCYAEDHEACGGGA